MFGYIHFLEHKTFWFLTMSFHWYVYQSKINCQCQKSNCEFRYMRSETPTVIEMPRLRILNENFDTPNRQFPVGTMIQLTCRGEVGNDASKVSIIFARKWKNVIRSSPIKGHCYERFQSFFFYLQCLSNAFSDSRKVKNKIHGLLFLVKLT